MLNRLLLICCVVLFSSCKEKKSTVIINEREVKESLIKINSAKVRLENDQIDSYVNRHGWPVLTTGTGLRYYIYERGEGRSAKSNMTATVEYCVTLLSGDTAYTSRESGPQDFLINMDNVESGLHEGIQYMKVGDRAKLVLPSYLAHGLVGDSKKIPPRTSIVYDIKLVSLR
jgi:FKBP-type peptidyl-prolyl cis-trans isomerase